MRKTILTAALAIACMGGQAQQQDILVIEKADNTVLRLNVEDIRRMVFESVNAGSIQGEHSTFVTADKPLWGVKLTGTDKRPEWTAPDPALFESSMFIMVKLQDELEMYSTDDDLMAVFIGDECRSVPAVRNVIGDGDIYFLLKIRGNSTDRSVTLKLKYYCAALQRIFNIEGQETFAAERTYGVDEDYVPNLLASCAEFPVQRPVVAMLPQQAPFTPTNDDLVAVFANDECRGVGIPGLAFTVFCTSEEEKLQLRYYSAKKGGIYTLKQEVRITDGTEVKLVF